MATRSDPFFGELYLRSTRPFLREDATWNEAALLRRFLERAPPGPVLDVGCGHGRHLQALRTLEPRRPFLGLDLDVASVAEAALVAPVLRADFSALPVRPASLAGAFVMYNSMFTLEDVTILGCLGGLVRCVKAGGVIALQASGWRRMAAAPTSVFDGELPDGSRLEERVVFDRDALRDRVHRILHTREGRSMAASFSIRYYEPDELKDVLVRCGAEPFEVATSDGRPLAGAVDYLVGAVRRG